MKKSLLFALLLVLSVVMVVTGLAWAQKKVIQPLQPAQIASLDQMVEMIVQRKQQTGIGTFWRQILVANPGMDTQAAVSYVSTHARQRLEANIAILNSKLKSREKSHDDKLNTRGDDQLVNADLQNTLQKQQQTLQTLSNITKMLSDTAMSVTRKMKD